MIVLVFNNGSTSLRFSIVDTEKNIVLANGGAEKIGTISSYFKYENNRGYIQTRTIEINNSNDALELIIKSIFDINVGVLNSVNDIDVIGHRVVHGGEKYFEPTFIDADVLNDIEQLSTFSPLHNKKIAENIKNCQMQFYGKENIAVFDTSFHLTIPKENYLYAIPQELYEKYKIRKYGFHGISYNYVLNRYIEISESELTTTNVVMCHLGGGSSICTIKNGKSFDTTMGLSPLSGLMMASRSGSIDPSMIPYIMNTYNMSVEEVINMLNKNSGYFAICNSKDAKEIVDRSLLGDEQVILLRNMINNDFKKHLLSMMANTENIDAIIMTGGISEKNIEQRELLLSNLSQFRIKLDKNKNNKVFGVEAIISDNKLNIPIYVIPTNEEKEIANQCKKLVLKKGEKMDKNIMLIGLGPHSKRIYMNYFKNHNIKPKILVDLESNQETIKKYLIENGYTNTILWTLSDKYKDCENLPEKEYKELLNLCKKQNVNYIISSTEPKAHNMYLQFALKNNINILSDKPITVVKNMKSIESINKVKEEFDNLLLLYKDSNCKCNIMCQRQHHRGYVYIKNLLSEIIKKYNIPITYIDIYHCDGNWEMPHDLDKENHPYKYGYGKLYHSGYHFIDLLAELIKLNNLTDDSKRIVYGEMYGNTFTPNDEKIVFNANDFQNIFGIKELSEPYSSLKDIDYSKYGEKNYYGNIGFYNCDNKMITTATISLLHYGFSRRGWFESRDYYKKNGRIRHERINIQVGPLLNIQVHSYQSKEIKDRENNINETLTGGLEHFDIDIYRNVDIIGGVPFQRIQLRDLYGDELGKGNFIGYNELSREVFINEFLYGDSNKGDLKDQKLAMEIMYTASKIAYNKDNNLIQIEKFDMPR